MSKRYEDLMEAIDRSSLTLVEEILSDQKERAKELV